MLHRKEAERGRGGGARQIPVAAVIREEDAGRAEPQ